MFCCWWRRRCSPQRSFNLAVFISDRTQGGLQMRRGHVPAVNVCSLGSDSVGSSHFKFSTHRGRGWLCHPVSAARCPPAAAVRPFGVERHSPRGKTDPGWWRIQAVNLCGNETMCTSLSAHNSAFPCRKQSAQCLLVAQLDTAVEPSQYSSSPRTGQDGALWPGQGLLLLLPLIFWGETTEGWLLL